MGLGERIHENEGTSVQVGMLVVAFKALGEGLTRPKQKKAKQAQAGLVQEGFAVHEREDGQ